MLTQGHFGGRVFVDQPAGFASGASGIISVGLYVHQFLSAGLHISIHGHTLCPHIPAASARVQGLRSIAQDLRSQSICRVLVPQPGEIACADVWSEIQQSFGSRVQVHFLSFSGL